MHHGELILGILVWWAFESWRKSPSQKSLLIFSLAVANVAFNDLIAIPHYVAVCIAVAFLMSWKLRASKPLMHVFMASGFGVVLAKIIQWTLNKTGILFLTTTPLEIPSLLKLIVVYKKMLQEVSLYIWDRPEMFFIFLLTSTFGLWPWLSRSWCKRLTLYLEKNNRSQSLIYFFTLIALSQWATLLAPLVTGLWAMGSWRYVMPFFLNNALFAVGLLALTPKKFSWMAGLLGLMIGLWSIKDLSLNGLIQHTQTVYYPQSVQCLDKLQSQYHLHRGLGGFWQAGEVNVSNRSGLWVNYIWEDGYLMHHLNNARWFYDSFGQHQKVQYDFVMTGSLDKQVILNLFGTPQSIEECGGHQIFIYGPAGQIKIMEHIERARYLYQWR